MLRSTLIILFVFVNTISFSQSQDAFVDRYFLIIASTKSADEAVTIAKAAAKKTGLGFRDSGLKRKEGAGATFPADSCEKWGEEYPCYYARGRYDDGIYLSVEYSSQYGSFAPDLFIVIAANGSKEDPDFKEGVKKVKKFYPKGYVKKCKVYMGCMH